MSLGAQITIDSFMVPARNFEVFFVVRVPWMMPASEPHHNMLIPPFEVVAFVFLLYTDLPLGCWVGLPLIDKYLEFRLQRLLPKQPFVVCYSPGSRSKSTQQKKKY